MRLQWHATLKLRNSAKTPSDGISSSSLTSADSGLVIWVSTYWNNLNFSVFFTWCQLRLSWKSAKNIVKFTDLSWFWLLVIWVSTYWNILNLSVILFSWCQLRLAWKSAKNIVKFTDLNWFCLSDNYGYLVSTYWNILNLSVLFSWCQLMSADVSWG